jgi:hypothetical protein
VNYATLPSIFWASFSAPDSSRMQRIMSSRISSRISTSTVMKTRTARLISLLAPTQRRERTKSTSLSMPPSVRKRVAAHAKRHGMSFSEFVTILCVNYLDAAEAGEQ